MCCECARQKRDSPVYLCCVSHSVYGSFARLLLQRLELQNFAARAFCRSLSAAISVAHLARNNSIFPPGSNACRALCHALPRCGVTLLSTDVFANNQFYTHELFRAKLLSTLGFLSSLHVCFTFRLRKALKKWTLHSDFMQLKYILNPNFFNEGSVL